ncbi:MFS general substrate transporter [Lindgomyces ingoldianus]|uniref:MFS general substrate transporter n=1 Tax=Lindgomyces ingoldianus TaxID=673940 RepID=A0ACB6Q887_9PLEO|nr:MFS general substrate transporter [Lindgomyces ingoldianus]KAF2462745.1 MFS general substrate transporter [Lindgomyces ingoldianus]
MSREGSNGGDETKYHLLGPKLYLIVLALCLSVMLVALDNAILATAIPTITTAFDSLKDVGWYGSAFLISICACQPLGGKIYQQFSLKWTFLAFLSIFELGSLICAVSPSSVVLIIGRAVAGIGASGIFSGALIIIAHCIPLKTRPVYTGLIASMFGVANVAGPVLGGALTQHASWRWCFWVNLPCGLVTAALLFFLFTSPSRPESDVSLHQKLLSLELPGFLLFIPTTVMFLLALQWGGTTYDWYSAKIISLLCCSVVMMTIFAAWQWREGDRASIPPNVIGQRTVASSAVVAFLAMGGLQLTTYYLPIWFQVIKGVSPTRSGLMYLPSVFGNMALSIFGGIFVTKVGYYNPVLFLGSGLVAVGGGLLTTWKPHYGAPYWISNQLLSGAGFGAIIQTPLIAVQAVLPLKQVSTATSTLVLCQFLGGSIFLSAAQNIFASKLIGSLSRILPPDVAEEVLRIGAVGIREVVSPHQLDEVILSYNDAIVNTFWIVMASGIVALVASFGMQWKSVRGVSLVAV